MNMNNDISFKQIKLLINLSFYDGSLNKKTFDNVVFKEPSSFTPLVFKSKVVRSFDTEKDFENLKRSKKLWVILSIINEFQNKFKNKEINIIKISEISTRKYSKKGYKIANPKKEYFVHYEVKNF